MKKLDPIKVQQALIRKQFRIFTPLDFQRVFRVSYGTARKFILRYIKRGVIVKLRKGLYMLADYSANQYEIANRLYEPSYISFDTALSFHGVIPETIYAITSVTPKTTREFRVEGVRFVYHKIKRKAYTGYKAIKHLESTILMAEGEKALADYLYFVVLKKRALHYERLDLKKIKKAKLLGYVKLFKRPQMIKLVEKIYAKFRIPKRIY